MATQQHLINASANGSVFTQTTLINKTVNIGLIKIVTLSIINFSIELNLIVLSYFTKILKDVSADFDLEAKEDKLSAFFQSITFFCQTRRLDFAKASFRGLAGATTEKKYNKQRFTTVHVWKRVVH